MLKNNRIEIRDQYVYASQSGKNNLEEAYAFWAEIASICKEANIFCVLGESKENHNFSLREAFQHIHFFKELGVKSYPKIAWVNHIPQQKETFLFIENLLNNRKLANAKLFTDFDLAENWLLEEKKEESIDLLDDSIFIFNK